MNKVFKDNNSKFCLIIALICLCLQYKNSDYKFILLFSSGLVISSFFTVNVCKSLLISLMGAFSLTYITTSINSKLVIKEGLDDTVPTSSDFMECYPVGEEDVKYIEEGYNVTIDKTGLPIVSPTTTLGADASMDAPCKKYCDNQKGADGNNLTEGSEDYTKCMSNCKHPDLATKFQQMIDQLLNSPVLAFIIGAASTYLVYRVGKSIWDSSIKNCINKPQV